MARFVRVQTEDREINQLQSNIAKLLEPLTTFLGAAGQLLGTSTSDSAKSGNVGEYLEVTLKTALAVTSNTYGDLDPGVVVWSDANATGLTLTPGEWDLQGTVNLALAVSTSTIHNELFIGTAKQTATTGQDLIRNTFIYDGIATDAGAGDSLIFSTPIFRVQLAASKTYYLKFKSNILAGTCTATANMYARRVR